MYELTQAVLDRLRGNVPLMALVSGIENRPPKRTQPGATPDAFQKLPGRKVPRLREYIMVQGPGEARSTGGPLIGELENKLGMVRIYYYVPATASGKVAWDAMDAAVRTLLNGWQFTMTSGYAATFEAVDLSELVDSESFEGSKQSIRRVSVEYLRSGS